MDGHGITASDSDGMAAVECRADVDTLDADVDDTPLESNVSLSG